MTTFIEFQENTETAEKKQERTKDAQAPVEKYRARHTAPLKSNETDKRPRGPTRSIPQMVARFPEIYLIDNRENYFCLLFHKTYSCKILERLVKKQKLRLTL